MVGNVAVSADATPNLGTLVLRSLTDVPKFRALARTISSRGSLPGIQLGFSPPGLGAVANWVTKDRGRELTRLRSLLLSMTDASLTGVLNLFTTGVTLAVRAGFD